MDHHLHVFADPGVGVLHDHILSRSESGDVLCIETWLRAEKDQTHVHLPISASSSHTSVFNQQSVVTFANTLLFTT